MDKLLPVLSSLLFQLPIILVWLVGIILALVFWRRHPIVSAMTLIAFIGFLILSFIGAWLNIWLPITLQEQGLSAEQISIIFTIRGAINALVYTFLWILVAFAIFGWRKKKEHVQ